MLIKVKVFGNPNYSLYFCTAFETVPENVFRIYPSIALSMTNKLIITVSSDNYSDELLDLEGNTAIINDELDMVLKSDIEEENQTLNLSAFDSISFEKRMNTQISLFDDFNEEGFDIVCKIALDDITNDFNDLANNDESLDNVSISSLTDKQKGIIKECLETINKITYKGTKIVNLDVDYILECGEIMCL